MSLPFVPSFEKKKNYPEHILLQGISAHRKTVAFSKLCKSANKQTIQYSLGANIPNKTPLQ